MAKRRKRRNKRSIALVKAAAVLVAAMAALLIFINSRVFVIQNISVVGNRTISSEEIIQLSGIQPGQRYGEKSDDEIRKNLERDRYIAYERCVFDYNSRRLTIHVTERMGWGVVGAFGLYYVLDETGIVLEAAGSQYPENAAGPNIVGLIETENANIRPTVGARLPIQTTSRLDAMEVVLKALDETNMLMRIATLDVTYPDDVMLLTDQGTRIELGNTDNLIPKLLIAQEVLYQREHLGDLMGARIDVSSASKAHFIPSILPTPTPVPTATPIPGVEETPR